MNPTARVVIVGKDPTHQIRRLALQHAGRVDVTGSVPDVRPYLRRATVAVAPVLYSAGIQNKVLEAMACGTPVIASPQAISALAAHPGKDLMAAGDEANFAAKILALLTDPAQQAQIGRAGRAYVERQHSWQTVTSQLESVYHRALEAQRGSASAAATPYSVARPESVVQPAGGS